ncbi:hydrophobin 2 [Mycena rebaudengoi]|nr:hydrophobin 2 [Mycena rebaudengoi]
MFSKLSIVIASVLITLAAAIPTGTPPPPIIPPSSPQCCSSVVPSTSTAASSVAARLGLDLTGLDVLIGVSCSPITGVFPNNCASISLTCDAPRKEWGGLIAINCFPVTA